MASAGESALALSVPRELDRDYGPYREFWEGILLGHEQGEAPLPWDRIEHVYSEEMGVHLRDTLTLRSAGALVVARCFRGRTYPIDRGVATHMYVAVAEGVPVFVDTPLGAVTPMGEVLEFEPGQVVLLQGAGGTGRPWRSQIREVLNGGV